jgi:MOSC domain-containing protein YiiM
VEILSIQVGLPKSVRYGDKEIMTGIFKEPVQGPVMLRRLSLEGDGQADLRVHGGVDKALYAYANDVYSQWKQLRPRDEFSYGAMGENLLITSLREDLVMIGDTFELGEAVIQAVQPRFPCFKLSIKFNDPSILKDFMEINRPGVYFRVLQEGHLTVGDRLKLVDREEVYVSVQELFSMLHNPDIDRGRIKETLKIKSLCPDWRVRLERKI